MDNKSAAEKRFFDALISLLKKKNFGTISVMDIVKEAKASRSTFYFYFESKYQLLEDLENILIGGFTDIMLDLRNDGKDKYYESISQKQNQHFIEYFKYIKKHSRAFDVLLNSDSQTGFSVRFTRAIMKTRLETSKRWRNSSTSSVTDKQNQLATEKIYREEVLSSIYVSLIKTWLHRKMDLSESEMAEMMIHHWEIIVNYDKYSFVTK